MMGVQFHLVPGHTNTTANTLITVSYWNGSAWVSVGTVDDGTKGTSQSMNKSGNTTWQAIAKGTEQTTLLSERKITELLSQTTTVDSSQRSFIISDTRNATSDMEVRAPLYYYMFSF